MQQTLLQILATAAGRARLDRAAWTRQGVGDEELSLIPLGPDEPRVVDDFARQLNAELARFNRERSAGERLRLRMAIHTGVAYPAENGFAGKGVVVVSRLLNSTPLRRALKAAQSANLALIVSDTVFTDVVRQGHTTLSDTDFRQVDIAEKEYQGHAWLWVPGVDVHRLELADPGGTRPAGDRPAERTAARDAEATEPAAPATRPAAGVTNVFHDRVDATHATFGFSGGARG